jgi:uncharacterized membrane protein
MNIIDIDENRDQGRVVGILAYLWIPGWIIALVLNGQKRSPLGSYHLRQSLGIMLVVLVLIWVIRYKPIVVGIQLLASIYGIVSAARYEKAEIPVIGPVFQDIFKGL